MSTHTHTPPTVICDTLFCGYPRRQVEWASTSAHLSPLPHATGETPPMRLCFAMLRLANISTYRYLREDLVTLENGLL